jgi:hypothetical protein
MVDTPRRFYTLMVLSTALFDKPPFKNLVCNGLVLAADGKKMSKRLKNYPVSGTPALLPTIDMWGARVCVGGVGKQLAGLPRCPRALMLAEVCQGCGTRGFLVCWHRYCCVSCPQTPFMSSCACSCACSWGVTALMGGAPGFMPRTRGSVAAAGVFPAAPTSVHTPQQ